MYPNVLHVPFYQDVLHVPFYQDVLHVPFYQDVLHVPSKVSKVYLMCIQAKPWRHFTFFSLKCLDREYFEIIFRQISELHLQNNILLLFFFMFFRVHLEDHQRYSKPTMIMMTKMMMMT
jgi:hypothetical protein